MQAEQQSDLLPCPFCGAAGLDFTEGSTFRWIVASCSGCGASIGETRIQTLGQGTKEEWMAIAQQDAIAAWNRRAALSHQSPQGWQDIESAPKDGEFLVYMPNERAKIQAARWHPNVKTIGGNFHFDLTAPTHWMPLPPPPEQGSKG